MPDPVVNSDRFRYPGYVQQLSEEPGVNWVSPAIIAVKGTASEVGVIATRDIKAGDVLVVYGGVAVDAGNMQPIDPEMRQYFYQVAPRLWYGPGATSDSLGIGERVNHSCVPNAGFSDTVSMVALCDIPAGAEIAVDYAKFQSDSLEGSTFECSCGRSECRGSVVIDDWRSIDPASPEYATCQPYMQSLISSVGSAAAKEFSSFQFPEKWLPPWQDQHLQSCLTSEAVSFDVERKCVHAARDILEGEVLFVGAGRVIADTEINSVPTELRRFFKRFTAGFMVGPRDNEDICALHHVGEGILGNVTRKLNVFVVAVRNIEAGHQLYFDATSKAVRP